MPVSQEIFEELRAELEQFILYDGLLKELSKILNGSGVKERFFKMLITRLRFLRQYGKTAQEHHKEYERIDAELYSMHLSSRDFNIRILYSFTSDGCILLHGFYERGGKKNTDYTKSLPIAKSRLHEIKE